MMSALSARASANPRPSRAMTPGRKFSTTTSLRAMSRRAASSDAAFFKSSAIDFLPALTAMNAGAMPS